MEHQNHPFDSPNSLRNRNNCTIEPATTASSLRNSGFHNNMPVPVTPAFSANSRNIIVPGNNTGALFSNRNLTSANWRNTNIATSQSNRAYFLLPSYSSNESVIPQSHPSYNLNRPQPDPIRTMSSPTSPQPDTLPTGPGTGQVTGNDAGNNANTSSGSQNDGSALSLVQVSKALAATTQQQQQQGGGRSGQTDMPYYAYCFDRGNGQYTRLVPADMLPPLVDVPSLQHGCIGMTVLPCPTGLAPNGRSSNLERVFVQVSFHT
jgi:hypothetical protein